MSVISQEQLALNKALHEQNDSFGNRAGASGLASYLPLGLIRMHQAGLCKTVLDYGTGKGLLVKRLRKVLPAEIKVSGYDPAVDKWSTKPNSKFDIITCLDVLEHIEMQSIDSVIDDISSLTANFCYVVVDLQPAVKRLANGRNAHILLAPPEWWVTRFSQKFSCITSFPIMHRSGQPQKVVIAATHNPQILPQMYRFINKLNIYNLVMAGGTLHTPDNK